eukprot:377895-Pelagomonas_calceolata.AAC.15
MLNISTVLSYDWHHLAKIDGSPLHPTYLMLHADWTGQNCPKDPPQISGAGMFQQQFINAASPNSCTQQYPWPAHCPSTAP